MINKEDSLEKKVTVINNSEQYSGIGQYSLDVVHSLLSLNYKVKYVHFGNLQDKKIISKEVSEPFQNFKFRNHLYNPFFYHYFALKKELSDIVHITSQFLMPLGAYRKKTIVTIHDLIQMHYVPRDLINGTLTILKFDFIHNYEHIVTDSKFVKDDILRHFNVDADRISVLYNSVDLSLFKPLDEMQTFSEKNGKIKIINVGNDQRNKNVHFLYQILKMLPNNFELVRVGKNSTRNINYLKKNNLISRVKFFSRISQTELVRLYNSSDLFIYPSIIEGFGRPLLEAMACGLPVILNNSSSLPEIAGDAGLKYSSNDPNDIVELIFQALDENTRMKLKSKSIEQSKLFSIKIFESNIKKLYDKI